jgi:hypothetical protein
MRTTGDRVRMDLRRLHCGKNELSVDALKAALLQLESGLSSRQVSVRSIRLGEVLCYEPQRDRAGDVHELALVLQPCC